jgi:hypothetical protein
VKKYGAAENAKKITREHTHIHPLHTQEIKYMNTKTEVR